MAGEEKIFDFGEETYTEESSLESLLNLNGSGLNDEFNLVEEDIFGDEPIDEGRSTDTITTFVNESNGLLEGDAEQIEQMQAEADTAPENIVKVEEVKAERTETPKEAEQRKQGQTMIIEMQEFTKEIIEEGLNIARITGTNAERVRTYTNKAVYFKQKHAKAKDGGDNPLKKLLIMALVCCAVGVFGGVYANSFWVSKNGVVESSLSCAFSWLMEFDTLPVSVSPLDMSAFMAGFGVWGGIMALIMFFSWDSSQRKKRNRDGKEHGDAKLMNSSGFKKYRNRFMER